MSHRRRRMINGGAAPYGLASVTSLVAHWSGNVASVSSVTNRVPGSTVGAMVQATGADQPSIITLTNGVDALRFDGSSEDLSTTDVAALRSTPKLYLAWHIRRPAGGNSGHIWSQWGAAERIRVLYINNTRFEVRVAIDASTEAQRNYNFTSAAFLPGIWLELLYDGDQATPADRLVFAVDGTPLTVTGSAGTLPTTLQAGDAVDAFLSSLNGGSTFGNFDIAHAYVANAIPSGAQRTLIREFEEPDWT